jgi:ribosomal protein L40E
LLGGAAKKVVDPIIAEMAKKYRLNKKICRKCYAHLDPKSTVCRKRRCGHWADIRMKKLMTEGGK